MSEQQDDDYWEWEDKDACINCSGTGEYVWCVDDMCRGQGWCMHEDICNVCQVCSGSGILAEKVANEHAG